MFNVNTTAFIIINKIQGLVFKIAYTRVYAHGYIKKQKRVKEYQLQLC